MSSLNVSDYNRLGKVYCAANVGEINHITPTAAQTGLSLFNPYGSGKKFILVDWGFVWTTRPAAVHEVGLALRANQITVPTSITAIVAKAADGRAITCDSVAIVASALTYGAAPVAIRWSFGAAWADNTFVNVYTNQDKVDGAICLIPGSGINTVGLTTTAAGMASFTWIEVPV